MPRHFRTLFDLGDNLANVLARAHELKRLRGTSAHPKPLSGKSVVLIFEKASTRTRLSFEIGVHELGGYAVVIMAKDSQLGRGEPLADTAKMLSGYAHMVMYRTFGHERIEALAEHATIPVINGLSDTFHPCQLLADLMTTQEEFGADLRARKVAWIGDGNNMAHSWLNAAALLGFELRVATPEGYDCAPEVVRAAQARGANVVFTRSPTEAANGADVVTTDVWSSMGQEAEHEQRARAFASFLVDEKLMQCATPDAIFLHCLPAHRGEEVTNGVIDGARSRIFAEAENRLHGQKALMEYLVSG